MSYVGNTPADKFLTLEKQQFSVSATTGYTLSHSVSSPQDIRLVINNVPQNPNSSYTVNGTALTLSSATSSGDTMYCVFLGKAIGTVAPASNSVTSSMMASGVLPTNTPSFHAHLNSNQSVSNNSFTTVICGTELYDSDGAYTTANGQFKPQTLGKYVLYAKTNITGGLDGSAEFVDSYLIRRDNSASSNVTLVEQTSGDGASGTNVGTTLFTVINHTDLNDYYTLAVYQNGGSLNIAGDSGGKNTYFGAYKLIGA